MNCLLQVIQPISKAFVSFLHKTLLFFFLQIPVIVSAQINSSFYVKDELIEKRLFTDTLAFINFINARQLEWINQGYFFSSLDSIVSKENGIHTFLYKGTKVESAFSGLKKRNILKQLNRKLEQLNNSGYPFATISLDSLALQNDVVSGNLKTSQGPEIRYDSAFFAKKPKTKLKYIYHLLEIKPKELFDESNYAQLTRKISRSPFLSLTQPTDISFSKNGAKIYLDIKENSTNTFEGVAGLQQNTNGETSLVGSLDLSIQNLFRSGHQFYFNWESFAESSQELNLTYNHAFLFESSISPSFKFSLLKQDTTFLTRSTGIGFSTFIFPRISLLVEYEGTNGTLLTSSIQEVEGRRLADYQRNHYRLAFTKGFLNALSRFEEGMTWKVGVGGGTKRITENIQLPASYYDTIDLNTNFVEVDARTAYQIKVGKRQTFFHEIHASGLANNEVLTNELYRIGGLNSLRGFNEKSFFAQYYLLSRLEVRSFFENSSFIYLFYDQLHYGRQRYNESPFGIGFGFALESSAGQFRFAIAGGKSDNQKISFSELRIHFGYTSRF